mgnify:CR=1 FL=1|tara:strand:+ start:162 stop:578 length:417 start_codon:yes stop_codon:yes gene_type:complete
MNETKQKNHALINALGHIKSIVKDYERLSYLESLNPTTIEQEEEIEQTRESILNSALSVQVRSGWTSLNESFEPQEFNILLSWGGPSLRIIGDLNEYKEPENPVMQFQDWFTKWEDLKINSYQYDALVWYCSQFYYGE